MTGLHWAASLRHDPRYLNLPYWPHRILVIGWGRLSRRAVFHPWQPCAYRLRLHHCCPAAPGWPGPDPPKPAQTTPNRDTP